MREAGLKMPRRLLILIAAALRLLPPLIDAAADCNRSCGSTWVPYPFGFSPECLIRLDCYSDVQIGDFVVRNFTSDSLVVDVPSTSCNMTSLDLSALVGRPNYGMSWRNVLLVRNCSLRSSSAPVDCTIPTVLSDRLGLGVGGCLSDGNNITCLSDNKTQGLFNYSEVTSAQCHVLSAAVLYESSLSATANLVFGKVELEWWVDGECSRCSDNATCTRSLSKLGGFRCSCNNGFQGDGFRDGDGCTRRKENSSTTACNSSKNTCSSREKETSWVAVLIGGIAAGASIVAAVALACCFLRRRSSSCKAHRSTQRLLSQASCTVPLYPYKDIERATNGFSDAQRLGTGAYGTVYSGKLHDDKLVAIKKIKHRGGAADEGVRQVMNEVKLLSSVSHPNLVRLLGCCIERREQILVYEFMPNGTLAQHLQREKGPALPWTVRLTIVTETARAVAYLHSAIHPPIYHRDIKSSNILLDYNFNSKVADFGLSRLGGDVNAAEEEVSHISTAPQGTPGYLDPQYHQNFHLSDKSDVYSFGVVLVEVITAMKVVDFNREQSEVNLAALAIDRIGKGRVDEIVDPHLEPHRDAWTLSSIHKVAELAFRCLAFHRDMRPSMTEVAEELEQVRNSGWATPDDVFMSPSSSVCSDDKSQSRGTSKSRRVVNTVVVRIRDDEIESPVSVVQDPWFSEQSSPSSNSLLGNNGSH